MKIELLNNQDLNVTVQQEVSALYKELNSTTNQRPLNQVLGQDNQVCVVTCTIEKQIVGIALMATFIVLAGHRGMVEDVVVANAHRGKGIGRKLMEKLLEEGRKRKLNDILLFSGHHRTAAIALYKSLGFTLRDSGIYNLKLT